MKLKIDKIFRMILILVFMGLVFEGIYIYTHWLRAVEAGKLVKRGQASLADEESEKIEQSQDTEILTESILPQSFYLDIPFVCQAPLGNWNPPFDHACEEAAILMVHYYFQQESIEPDVAAKEISEIIDFEMENYGFHKDTSAEQTAQLIRDYFGYKARVYYDASLEDIKKELIEGNPVIVPTAGRMLENPYFTPPGPLVHMLVIKGYTSEDFIVNDPGTRKGADYTYSYSILEEAIHDWSEGDVENGSSAMIVIQK